MDLHWSYCPRCLWVGRYYGRTYCPMRRAHVVGAVDSNPVTMTVFPEQEVAQAAYLMGSTPALVEIARKLVEG